jgi:hypothetical protein
MLRTMTNNKQGDIARASNEGSSMDAFLHEVDVAISSSQVAAQHLLAAPSLQTAEEACLACRNAVQYLFFARSDFGQEISERLTQLRDVLSLTKKILEQLKLEPNHDPIINGYLTNLRLRERLLLAIGSDDPSAVRRLLKNELAAASH